MSMFPSPLEVDRFISVLISGNKEDLQGFRPLSR